MLPKPEKNKRTKAEQLDLVKGIDQNLKNRRKSTILIIALLLTIGLSIGLWTYRHLIQVFANPISFTLPSFFLTYPPTVSPPPSLVNLEPVVSPIISNTSGHWSFLISHNDRIIWQKGTPLSVPTSKLTPSQPLVSSSLPEGLKVTESITQTPDSLQDIIDITLPNQHLIFIINLSQTPDPAAARAIFPRLASAVYWAII